MHNETSISKDISSNEWKLIQSVVLAEMDPISGSLHERLVRRLLQEDHTMTLGEAKNRVQEFEIALEQLFEDFQ